MRVAIINRAGADPRRKHAIADNMHSHIIAGDEGLELRRQVPDTIELRPPRFG